MNKQLIFIGDNHNNVSNILWSLKAYDISFTTLVQVGDFGVGISRFEVQDEQYERLSKELDKRDSYLYVIRGNHDNPKYFGTLEYDRIKFVADYDVLEFNDERILCLGGAISVDRQYRQKNGHPYWPNEFFNYNLSKIENLTDITIVASHNSPNFAYPMYGGYLLDYYAKDDLELRKDIAEERALLTSVYERLQSQGNPLKLWTYGHFHEFNLMTFDDVEFRCLTVNEWFNIQWHFNMKKLNNE